MVYPIFICTIAATLKFAPVIVSFYGMVKAEEQDLSLIVHELIGQKVESLLTNIVECPTKIVSLEATSLYGFVTFVRDYAVTFPSQSILYC